MNKIQNENTKAANQAWRRKPRKFAPKSRLGCKTCKIRRVKCDLSRPSCLKCYSTGRSCDGYAEMPLAPKTEVEFSYYHNGKANRAESCDSHHPCTTISACQPKQWRAKYHGLTSHNLGPFMVLPVTGSAQTEAISFFEFISIKHLNEYHPCESWRRTLMFFSQTVPAVRYAATALALIHRKYLNRDFTDREHQPQSLKDQLPDKAPLLHYNRAIQLLLNQENGDSIETTAVTLLVCYLFTCFDHLAGNYVQAIKHLRGGVELSRNVDKAILNNNSTYEDAVPSGIHTLMSQVTRQIRRLDIQAVTFLVDWTPADIQDTFVSQLPPFDSAFQSLDQAADHIHILVAQVMRLRNTEQQNSPLGKMPASSSSLRDVISGQLEISSSLFENMLQQGSSHETDPEPYPLISLLRLQHTIAWTLLHTSGPGREMDYDNFLPQFQQCVTLAVDVAAAHVRYSGSLKPSFTPEVGIVPVLYIIGVKCRHPVVRREVLSILRRQPIREAVWDSISAAKVVERVIEIEEGGSKEWDMAQSMDQIVMWQRIETMSWIQVNGQSAARVDISYTFCGREGMHTESLMI
ncbi:c6 transcription [Colletotrichum incanum]|uniref:C6 transcription n=1 Tax=Colletotrichum incanum TaxID=1573173 RepID=A0A167BQ60_COLIC|nr:c6 transcription [Colletotrichum incanum]OHW96948.1 C6 transcription factor [Colletotrichum incanum]